MGEERLQRTLILQIGLILFLCLRGSRCSLLANIIDLGTQKVELDALLLDLSPVQEPQPLVPIEAPSPLMPYTYNSVPTLSGICSLNFSAAETILSTTATDCWDSLAPYLANVVCCPQFHATIETLVGQSSVHSGKLLLNVTHARNCLSDVEKILESQGANKNLGKICSISPSNLTEGSCPIVDVHEIEKILDFPALSTACKDIDQLNECCKQVCQNAILDAADKLTTKNHSLMSSNGAVFLPAQSSIIDDCKRIVLRWLASKLDPSSSNAVFRGLYSCNINRVCPLVFPDIGNVTKECGYKSGNQTACCKAMKSYMSQMQGQSFLTNLQAINCAALLGNRLQKANISINIYALCRVKLKDFSVQVGSQDSGCLFPSLPSDVTFDQNKGISFICDLNDNVEASWPSTSFAPAASCNHSATQLPELPKATSAQSGIYVKDESYLIALLFSSFLVLKLLI